MDKIGLWLHAYLREPHWSLNASPFGVYCMDPPGIQSVMVASISVRYVWLVGSSSCSNTWKIRHVYILFNIKNLKCRLNKSNNFISVQRKKSKEKGNNCNDGLGFLNIILLVYLTAHQHISGQRHDRLGWLQQITTIYNTVEKIDYWLDDRNTKQCKLNYRNIWIYQTITLNCNNPKPHGIVPNKSCLQYIKLKYTML